MQEEMMFRCAEMRCWRNDVCAGRKMMCRCAAMEDESPQGELFAKPQASSPSQSPAVTDSPFCRYATSFPGAGEVFPQRGSL